ncbi:MAG TPA: hypothetical protein PK295_03515 [Candidatus Magasanikbacteria bacterium]|nr:hypothetical protein [Candidatus Magasanikbacteria bacterium]
MRQQIVHPFLLLITNSHESQWYRVESQNRMMELESVVEEKTHFSDNEGHSRGGGASGGNLKTNEIWDEETRKHLDKAVRITRELYGAAEYHTVVVAAPENLKNLLLEELTLPKVAILYIPGNFTHENLHQKLLEKIHEV